jgi:hypothetical protein
MSGLDHWEFQRISYLCDKNLPNSFAEILRITQNHKPTLEDMEGLPSFVASKGSVALMSLLVSLGADITEFNHQPLYISVRDGNLEMLKYIESQYVGRTPIDYNKKNCCDNWGDSLFETAIVNGHLNIVKYIATTNIVGLSDIAKCDKYAQMAFVHGFYDIVNYFELRDGIVDYKNKALIANAMLHATLYSNLRNIRKLIKLGGEIQYSSYHVVRCAEQFGKIGMLWYFMSIGAPLSVIRKDLHQSIAEYACKFEAKCTIAAKRIYFWWIRRCYVLYGKPSGIRMMFRNITVFHMLCENS